MSIKKTVVLRNEVRTVKIGSLASSITSTIDIFFRATRADESVF